MADTKLCSIDGCDKRARGRGWCDSHYGKWLRHGDPLGGRSTQPGDLERYVSEVAFQHESDDCLFWPYGKNGVGYGLMCRNYQKLLAHRVVCEHVHGPAPTPKHDAAHSCGKGHLGCVNPRHLRWATRKENFADKITHGTHNRGERCSAAKLTEADVLTIRSLKGKKLQREIATMFGVHKETIGKIHRRVDWAWLD